MNTDAPSRTERVYANIVTVLVAIFFVLIFSLGFLRNGRFDVTEMKAEGFYFLAYIGSIAIALWLARFVLDKVSVAAIRIGLPLFVLTTWFNWVFPSHLRFIEHLGINLMLAVFASWVGQREITLSEG